MKSENFHRTETKSQSCSLVPLPTSLWSQKPLSALIPLLLQALAWRRGDGRFQHHLFLTLSCPFLIPACNFQGPPLIVFRCKQINVSLSQCGAAPSAEEVVWKPRTAWACTWDEPSPSSGPSSWSHLGTWRPERLGPGPSVGRGRELSGFTRISRSEASLLYPPSCLLLLFLSGGKRSRTSG